MAGASSAPPPRGRDGAESAAASEGAAGAAACRVDVTRRAARRAPAPSMGLGSKRHPQAKGRAWVLHKKDQARGKGVDVPRDSRFTARRRKRAL